jgi:hypothetical protein
MLLWLFLASDAAKMIKGATCWSTAASPFVDHSAVGAIRRITDNSPDFASPARSSGTLEPFLSALVMQNQGGKEQSGPSQTSWQP